MIIKGERVRLYVRGTILGYKSQIRRIGLSSISGTGGQASIPGEEITKQAELPVDKPRESGSKLLVLGGNGFVGSAICKEAVLRGIPVQSLSRSGPPRTTSTSDWVKEVDWARGDVLEVGKWKTLLSEASAVVSCIGAFGSNGYMLRINGLANAQAAEAAAQAGVKRFVFISAHDVGLPSFILRGYYEGKRTAEEAVKKAFPYGGVILRPAMIHGTRRVGSASIPLSLVGAPFEAVLSRAKWASNLPLVGSALVPPVNVTAVAKTAVQAATDHSIPPGVIDVWGILRIGDGRVI